MGQPNTDRIFRQRREVRNLLFSEESLIEKTRSENVVNEPSVMKPFLEIGKDTDPGSITARLLLLTAAPVRLLSPNSLKFETDKMISSFIHRRWSRSHACDIRSLCHARIYRGFTICKHKQRLPKITGNRDSRRSRTFGDWTVF